MSELPSVVEDQKSFVEDLAGPDQDYIRDLKLGIYIPPRASEEGVWSGRLDVGSSCDEGQTPRTMAMAIARTRARVLSVLPPRMSILIRCA